MGLERQRRMTGLFVGHPLPLNLVFIPQ